MSQDLMLVGSIAYDSAEETFRAIAPRLGQWLPFVPDGVRPVFCMPCLKQQTR